VGCGGGDSWVVANSWDSLVVSLGCSGLAGIIFGSNLNDARRARSKLPPSIQGLPVAELRGLGFARRVRSSLFGDTL